MAALSPLKLGHIAEPDNVYGQGADHFAKTCVKNAARAISISGFIHPASLATSATWWKGLGLGTVDMTLTGTAVMGQLCARNGRFDLPSFFRDVNPRLQGPGHRRHGRCQKRRKGHDHPGHPGKRRPPH